MCCVGNDNDLRAVTIGADGAFAGMKKGATFVDHTTASAEVARELDAAATKAGFKFVDAPVSGGQAGAENGVLTVMCGGTADAYAGAEPVIAAYARMCKLLGPAGSGQLTKMVNQICIAGLVQGLSEGIHFAKKSGLDVHAVIETISKGAAQSWQMENRYKTMNDGQVRFRLCGRMDAQGPLDLHRRSPPQRRQSAGDRAGRSVLFGGGEDGRQALGYVEPAGAAAAVEPADQPTTVIASASEAIHPTVEKKGRMDCFVAALLAMTTTGQTMLPLAASRRPRPDALFPVRDVGGKNPQEDRAPRGLAVVAVGDHRIGHRALEVVVPERAGEIPRLHP